MATSGDNSYPADNAARAALYAVLADFTPEQRTERLLQLLEECPPRRLDLSACCGLRATLDGIDLSRSRMLSRHDGVEPPHWWNTERQSVDLQRVQLQGASLRGAQLQGTLLEEADLTEADLAGADLQAASLSGSIFERALLEGADLRNAVLRYLRGAGSVLEHAKLQGADLWGAELPTADLSAANFQEAILEEANLQDAELVGVDFRGAVLKRANLQRANFRGADLRGAEIGGADLTGAFLSEANIEGLDLTGCILSHVHTCGARLEKTRLEQDQLRGAIGEELNKEYELARKGYLALERNFNELGDHDAACWAYRRRRRMEKRGALVLAANAWREGQMLAAVGFSLKYSGDQLIEWVCDYGESVWRVLGTLIVAFVIFLPLYGLTGTVLRVEPTPNGKIEAPTFQLSDLALFSLTAMTSLGNPPEYLRPRNELGYLLNGVQTLLSVFLTGLMGFVAGNRIRR